MFITIEGMDGSGKSTQVAMLADRLEKNKFPYVRTREPGGTEIAEKLREYMIREKHTRRMGMMLSMTARVDHVEKVVVPALLDGRIVISDRYYDSALAMQGYAEGFEDEVYEIIDLLKLPEPTLTFFLMTSYDTQLARMQGRNLDAFESRGRAYHELVRDGFERIQHDPRRKGWIVMIQTDDMSVEQVHEKIVEHVRTSLIHTLPNGFTF